MRRIAWVMVTCAVLGACSHAATILPPSSGGPAPSTAASADARIGVIVLENKEYTSVIGNSDAPYLNALAKRSALLTSYYAITHPSLPNYIALTSGGTHGITRNCTDCRVSSPSLPGQMSEKHITWRAYIEGVPTVCSPVASDGRYAKKHNPFVYFDDVTTHRDRCANVVPLSRWRDDDDARFLWITPDLCSDMHDCSVATGDRFMRKWVPRMLRTLGPHGLLFVTFDEGSSDDGCCALARGGRITTIVTGPLARPGTYDRPADHYSTLRLIEDLFGLKRLAGAADSRTPSIGDVLRTP